MIMAGPERVFVPVAAVVWGATGADRMEALAALRRDSGFLFVSVGDRVRYLHGPAVPPQFTDLPDVIHRARDYGWAWAIVPVPVGAEA